MKKYFWVIAIIIYSNTITAQENSYKAVSMSSVEQAAKQETAKWKKLLELDSSQEKTVYQICKVFARKEEEMNNQGFKFPPGPKFAAEKGDQFKTVLNQDQYREYVKIVQKEIPDAPAKKKPADKKAK